MPTLEHNGVVSLFRDKPELALRFLGDIGHIQVPAYASVRVADTALDQMVPIEFRADLVLDVLDEQNKFVLAVVLEVQREIKERKKYTWPVYVAASRAERECPAILMVVAVDEDVAAWAQRLIDLGFDRASVEPVVLGPQTIPEITDKQRGRQEVELALLSGMAHGNGTNSELVLRAAVAGITLLDQEHAMVYFQLLWNVLREPMQQTLQRLVMENSTGTDQEIPQLMRILMECGAAKGFQDGEVKGFRDGEVKGFHDGEVKGFRDGEAKGEVKGKIDAVRGKIFRGAQRRGLVLSDEQQARIHACNDLVTLDRWFDNVFDAKTADELFR